jgi:HAD superfamily hydrolase (TIGR01490 family)
VIPILNGAQFLISKGRRRPRIAGSQKRIRFYEQYKDGTLDIYEFLNFQLAPLTRHPRAELDAWHQEYMERHILPIMSAEAKDVVKQHRDNGDLCAIVTATNSFVTGPIARAFGIPHLIATIPAVDPQTGAFSGAPRGTPSFREGKIERVEAWLESLGLCWASFDDSYFYSDSHNDLPLMNKVKTPVAVDPDDKLRQHSEDAGWIIISLRD